MKLQTTNNCYKASNNEINLFGDMTSIEATSYDWWYYVQTDSVGNIVFNNFSYSISTSSHQGDARTILRRLSLKPAITLEHTGESMRSECGIKSAIADEIRCIKDDIRLNIEAIRTKGSWKKKNKERREEIRAAIYRIADLRNYNNNYINKRVIPTKTSKLSVIEGLNTYNKHLTNYKGKVDLEALRQVADRKAVGRDNEAWISEAPDNIDVIVEYFGLKTPAQKVDVLCYQFSNDLNGMIPAIDTDERIAMDKWVKRQGISRDNLNALDLDKLHSYLVNKMNRKTYTPSAPIELPVHDKLVEIEREHKELKLINSVQELRAEGRRQSHCIGGKYYQDKCLRGYQALNYKGYTFFLEPDLSLVETHGRHNAYTPDKIRHELEELVA